VATAYSSSVASKLAADGKIVVDKGPGVARLYRVVDLDDEPRGRAPTAEEQSMPNDSGASPPKSWNLRKDWTEGRRGKPNGTHP